MLPPLGANIILPMAEIRGILPFFSASERDTEPAFVLHHFSSLLNLIPNLTRLSIMAIFIGSFFLQPLKRPIMTIWERIIDSEKPFTLLFGGGATIVTIFRALLC
jgi:hypothetical protein